MRPLCAGKRRRRDDSRGGNRSCRLHMQLHALVAKQVDAGTSMNPSTPVTPSERFSPDYERMQQDTHLARLFGGAALPLTLLAQWAGTTPANAGPIHHTQTAIDFSTLLLDTKLLVCWTAKGPVLPLKMVDKSTSPLQTHFRLVFGYLAVQTDLLFPE
jgi:hypothetical protein